MAFEVTQLGLVLTTGHARIMLLAFQKAGSFSSRLDDVRWWYNNTKIRPGVRFAATNVAGGQTESVVRTEP